MRIRGFVVPLFLALLCAAGIAYAAGLLSTLTVEVAGDDGPIPGALVRAVDSNGGFQYALTDKDGFATFRFKVPKNGSIAVTVAVVTLGTSSDEQQVVLEAGLDGVVLLGPKPLQDISF